MAHELSKAYDPSEIEKKWADFWVTEDLFSLPTPETSGKVFTLLLPPPNVTGRLHMGHMLNQTEMDIITRWKRMSGFKTLWLPGTDHAGIATQMMVERQLATEGKKRQDLGREAFIERVWEWRREYGGAIQDQMKRLGASVDWAREYFTMDENLSRAVREAFVRLYEDGLIYRGKYIVNWCPRCMTAISDLEVVHQETQGKLYEIRYPIIWSAQEAAERRSADAGMPEHIVVATTRPETMLGDTAIAVSPHDERYKNLVGLKVRVPLIGREIPIIADDWANPEFGTGAVKVTPAHDPNDFAIGKRHDLPQISVMDENARILEGIGDYGGLDRFKAREKILADLEAQNLLASVKDHTLSLGRCTRCNTVVEPRLSTQWFVKIQPLAEVAIQAVEDGHIRFTPEQYKKTYFEWMRNIHDWCISRQLWWGHRIPAWQCDACEKHTVARETPQKCAHCGRTELTQETDVLDTWFSSGLLPFTVFGWPDKTKDLEVFYPTSLLITGFDILFFWVARMIMLGCWFMKDRGLAESVPFKEVYIHALVRDAERQKMSKTKGNVVDPIQVIEQYGTDAVRFTLASLASPGTDIAFNPERVEGNRAFANKIWNAARFLFMHREKAGVHGIFWDGETFVASTRLEDVWIRAKLNAATVQVNAALAQYRFHEAAHVVYHFFWGEFCDWYLEIIKLRLNQGETSEDKATTCETLLYSHVIFDTALRLLSPFMPFITEEIWQALYEGKTPKPSIALAEFPISPDSLGEPQVAAGSRAAEDQMAILQALIVDIRAQRAELKVEPKIKVPINIFVNPDVKRIIENNQPMVEKLANVESIRFVDQSLAGSAGARVAPQYEMQVIYEQKIDAAAERERLNKDLVKLEKEFSNNQRQLGNEQFLSKAPAPVVEGLRRRAGELELLLEKTKSSLAQLG